MFPRIRLRGQVSWSGHKTSPIYWRIVATALVAILSRHSVISGTRAPLETVFGKHKLRIRTMNPMHSGRGWLKNDNQPGDFSRAICCGAKTRPGTPCKSPAMRNGRCRMHGGASTGPRTPEGLEGSRRANWKTGEYSAQAKIDRRVENAAIWVLRINGIFRPRAGRPPSWSSVNLLAKQTANKG